MISGSILILALLIDLIFGDPRTALHPVGWMGRFLFFFRDRATAESAEIRKTRLFLLGLAIVVLGSLLTGGLAVGAEILLGNLALTEGSRLLTMVGVVGAAIMLKGALAFRSLIRAGRSVESALEEGDIEKARSLLSRHLVSRPVKNLDEASIASAAIESMAENFADSVVAPLFYYALSGIGGAYIYRYVDTADSVLGYRDPVREWLGKASARFDDALCFLPARLSGWFLLAAAVLTGQGGRKGWTTMHRDAKKCPSPNSGWPMAAAAGILGIRLEKNDTYVLNEKAKPPEARDIQRCIRLLRFGLLVALLPLALLAALIPSGFHGLPS